MKNMKVAEVEFDFKGESKDWKLCNRHASFSHKEASEFIFYVGEPQSMQAYKDHGFSERFLKVLRSARRNKFKYVCVYA